MSVCLSVICYLSVCMSVYVCCLLYGVCVCYMVYVSVVYQYVYCRMKGAIYMVKLMVQSRNIRAFRPSK